MGLFQLITTLFLLHLFSNPTEAVHRNGIFTHLKNDNTPCHAENLKVIHKVSNQSRIHSDFSSDTRRQPVTSAPETSKSSVYPDGKNRTTRN